jgi:large conductance mechanosensitive channel
MSEFINFLRKQGVIGLAVGFILGGAVSKVVAALVNDVINPIIGLALNRVSSLEAASFSIGSARILWGDFVGAVIDFIVVAFVVYYGFKWLRLDKLDKAKD